MKYKATFQDEFLIASNLLGAETIDELGVRDIKFLDK